VCADRRCALYCGGTAEYLTLRSSRQGPAVVGCRNDVFLLSDPAAFYGRDCQDKSLPAAADRLAIWRLLPQAGTGLVLANQLHAPFWNWVCCRHPCRVQSRPVLHEKVGTIFLFGPLMAMASFGTPRGHSLTLWTPRSFCGTKPHVDASSRTDPVCGCCANPNLGSGLLRHPTDELFRQSFVVDTLLLAKVFLWFRLAVWSLALPYRQRDRCQFSGYA